MRTVIAAVVCLSAAFAQESYKKPPREILEVLQAPPTPQESLSPARDVMILRESHAYPPIADVAQPMLRLAGLRINPRTNGPHTETYAIGLVLKKIADGTEIKVTLPPAPRISSLAWSPDGKHYAFLQTTRTALELWVGDRTGQTRRLATNVNAVAAKPLEWMPDSRALLVHLVPAGRGAPPTELAIPAGPDVQESAGKAAGTGTFEDLLQNAHDEKLYEYYATAQLALVGIAGGQVTPLGKPAIFETTAPAPDGKHLLVARIHRPFSYLYTFSEFPKEIEIWDTTGKLVRKIASAPLADAVPLDGVPGGPRHCAWKPTDPATLIWVEALDGGDPRRPAPFRDRVLALKAPFAADPVELAKVEHRFMSLQWMEDGTGVLSENDRARRWTRTLLLDASGSRELVSRSTGDRYRDPGRFVHRGRSFDVGAPQLRGRGAGSEQSPIMVSGDSAFLIGLGAGPEGDRPFLDRLDLKTLKTERLFRSAPDAYEVPLAVLNPDGPVLLTRRENPADPPNYFVRTGDALRALTNFTDHTPQLRKIKAQLVKYKRADGVQCSFTLYLPPDYKEGRRLPTVMWAYPREYNDPDTAGQVAGSAQRFTAIRGYSHLFFLLRGYAVLDGATMPVVGDFKTANDTYIEQIVMSAKAAIDKAVEMGVTDRDRVGVGGHSYGAFMTANLLAHCDLFRAGIARSGAYNRTLTPFGFQAERRTLWEAPDIYLEMSPFLHADKIKAPILLIHGEADNNMGTFPIQSDRMYAAIRGNGGTVRLVMLPAEAHAYAARESVEHVLYEMTSWFDRYLKDAGPRSLTSAADGR
jgi:dipeptidyl aminopeptidase/acylaminoacyl peptidase